MGGVPRSRFDAYRVSAHMRHTYMYTYFFLCNSIEAVSDNKNVITQRIIIFINAIISKNV